jgi:hypothetical protein
MTTPREQLIEAIARAIANRPNPIEYAARPGWAHKADAEAALQAIEDQDYVLIKAKDEQGNPLIVASAEAVQQISKIAIEEFRQVLKETKS